MVDLTLKPLEPVSSKLEMAFAEFLDRLKSSKEGARMKMKYGLS